MHAIRAETAMSQLGAFSKADTSWEFLSTLFMAGRATATEWLDKNYQRIGHESTVDLKSDYL